MRCLKPTGTAGHPFDADPPERKHRAMVVDVQKRQLIVLLAQHKEQRIGELEAFGEVEPPNGTRNLYMRSNFD